MDQLNQRLRAIETNHRSLEKTIRDQLYRIRGSLAGCEKMLLEFEDRIVGDIDSHDIRIGNLEQLASMSDNRIVLLEDLTSRIDEHIRSNCTAAELYA